jgi:hypothetical protein
MIATAQKVARERDNLLREDELRKRTLGRIMKEHETLQKERDDARAEASEIRLHEQMEREAKLARARSATRGFPADPEALLECCREVVRNHPRIDTADVARHWPRKGAS